MAELRENPNDLATLYNDFAVKYRVRAPGEHRIAQLVHDPCKYMKRACGPPLSGRTTHCLMPPEALLHLRGNVSLLFETGRGMATQVWRLCLEMVALGDFNDAVYVRQLWDVHLKSTCVLSM